MSPVPTAVPTLLSPHAHPLDLVKLLESIGANNSCKDKRPSADSDEAVIRFFDEVLKIHAVQAGDERAGSDAECADTELQVEEH